MTTSATPAVVSLLTTLALGACTTHTRGAGLHDGAAPPPLSIRFDNNERERVHVYLVGETREWLLGRIEPGGSAWLRVPTRALTGGAGAVRLAVLAGAPPSVQAAREARAIVTMAQPAAALLERRWTLSQGQLVSLLPPGRR